MLSASGNHDEKFYLSTQTIPSRTNEEDQVIGTPLGRLATSEPAQSRSTAVALRAAKQFWIWLFILFLFAGTYGVINRYIITSVIVQGRSMAPTLEDGERYLLNRWTYTYRAPERGDVVVLRDPGHSDLAIKRIVGVPGDSIQLKRGGVLINGKPFVEAYLASGTRTYAPDMHEQLIMLGDDQYFVLGDNRAVSEDSRFYGPIHRQRIVGCITR